MIVAESTIMPVLAALRPANSAAQYWRNAIDLSRTGREMMKPATLLQLRRFVLPHIRLAPKHELKETSWPASMASIAIQLCTRRSRPSPSHGARGLARMQRLPAAHSGAPAKIQAEVRSLLRGLGPHHASRA